MRGLGIKSSEILSKVFCVERKTFDFFLYKKEMLCYTKNVLNFLSEHFSQNYFENRLTNGADSCIIILERTFVHEHMNGR